MKIKELKSILENIPDELEVGINWQANDIQFIKRQQIIINGVVHDMVIISDAPDFLDYNPLIATKMNSKVKEL